MTVDDHVLLEQRRSIWPRMGCNIAALAGVALGALLVGGVTSPAQGFLPDEFTSFANSPSGWTIVTFAMVWLSRLRPVWAAVAGALAFVLMVDGYRIVSEWRGLSYGAPFQDMYTYIGLFVGPFVGAGAALLRYGPSLWRLLSVGPLVVVMIGDGVYGLTTVRATTSPVYWWIVLVGGIGIAVVHLARIRPGRRHALLFVGLTIAFVALYLGAVHIFDWIVRPAVWPSLNAS